MRHSILLLAILVALVLSDDDDDFVHYFAYKDGPIVGSPAVHIVLWGEGDYLPFVTETKAPSITSFYRALLTDGAFTTWLDRNYRVPQQRFSCTGSVSAQPIRLRPLGEHRGQRILDGEIQAEIDRHIALGLVPAPARDVQGHVRTVYAVYFPRGAGIALPGSGYSCSSFCAYHKSVRRNYTYLVFPDLQRSSGCESGCGRSRVSFEVACMLATHELAEAMTDPFTCEGVTTWRSFNGELADVCANWRKAPYRACDGHTYTLAQLYSRTREHCEPLPEPADCGVAPHPTTSPWTLHALLANTTARSLAVSVALLAGDGQATVQLVSSRALIDLAADVRLAQVSEAAAGSVSPWPPTAVTASVLADAAAPNRFSVMLQVAAERDDDEDGVADDVDGVYLLNVSATDGCRAATLQDVQIVASVGRPLANGGFEAGTWRWSLWPTTLSVGGPCKPAAAAVVVASSSCHSGRQCLRLGPDGPVAYTQRFLTGAGLRELKVWVRLPCAKDASHGAASVALRDLTTGTACDAIHLTLCGTDWQNVTFPIAQERLYQIELRKREGLGFVFFDGVGVG